VPAAAVIPAPIAYIKFAAVKKLVVGCVVWCAWSCPGGVYASMLYRVGGCTALRAYHPVVRWSFGFSGQLVYFESIRVFQAG
jgi:hypothetical protein